jgi:hypothetical protein
MSLQKSIIKQYKEIYPKDKLKDISAKTGIQITRIFRILNGSEMKLKEYEVFDEIVNSKTNNALIIKLAKDCLLSLSSARRSFIISNMQQALKINSFKISINNQGNLPTSSSVMAL